MKLEAIIIGILLISGIVIGTYSFFWDMGDDYNVTITQNLSSFNKTTEIGTKLNESLNKVTTQGISLTSFIGEIGLVWDTVKLLITIPFDVGGMILNNIFTVLPIPAWAMGIIIVIFVVILIMALLALVLRFNP